MAVYSTNNQPGRVNFGWIGESFSIFWQNPGVWVVAALISGIVEISISVGTNSTAWMKLYTSAITHTAMTTPPPSNPLITAFALVVSIALRSYFYTGYFVMANKSVRSQPITLGDFFSGYPYILTFIGYSLLMYAASFAGFLLCCVGYFFAAALLWPGYALIADGDSIGSALNRSWEAMKNDSVNGALFVFVFLIIMILTALPTCGLATLVTTPMMMIIAALAVRDMIPPKPGEYVPTAAGVWPPPPASGIPSQQVYSPPPRATWPAPPPAPAPRQPGEQNPPEEPNASTADDKPVDIS